MNASPIRSSICGNDAVDIIVVAADVRRRNVCKLISGKEIFDSVKCLPPKDWRPAFAGRQNQTQGVEAHYAISIAPGRVMVGLFAAFVMTTAVGDPESGCC